MYRNVNVNREQRKACVTAKTPDQKRLFVHSGAGGNFWAGV